MTDGRFVIKDWRASRVASLGEGLDTQPAIVVKYLVAAYIGLSMPTGGVAPGEEAECDT